jgi:two-component system copper resistance phosphate regulon response regulator CusR
MRILLVEDEVKIARFVRRALQEQGFVVELVGDGDEAYERAQRERYDVIVLDIMLPGRDGRSLAREIARAHGGDVVLVESRDDRTTFRMTLPLAGPISPLPAEGDRPAADGLQGETAC